MTPEPAPPVRRRPIVEGARVRHILGATGIAKRVEGNQVFVLWDDNGENALGWPLCQVGWPHASRAQADRDAILFLRRSTPSLGLPRLRDRPTSQFLG